MNDNTPPRGTGGALCFFAADLHGDTTRYGKLFTAVRKERPAAVFLGGDLLPSHLSGLAEGGISAEEFILGYLAGECSRLKERLGGEYPAIFLILGNDDPRSAEEPVLRGESLGHWRYAHGKKSEFAGRAVYGYSYVPPTPFLLKDWERYDVSVFVDPGCVHPTEGWRTFPVDERETKSATIREDLAALTGGDDLSGAILLFHAPPYRTNLDRAALDGKFVDHAPLDVHVGSIAIREFTEQRQPLVTLHGHVHESARITGSWRDRIGNTEAFTAAHDGRALALVRFDPADLPSASRALL